jgi:hypothetical protein
MNDTTSWIAWAVGYDLEGNLRTEFGSSAVFIIDGRLNRGNAILEADRRLEKERNWKKSRIGYTLERGRRLQDARCDVAKAILRY